MDLLSHKEQIDEAISVLKNGGVVVIPTETAYGLAVDATQADAIAHLFAVKGRDHAKTPPLIVATEEMAEQFMVITPLMKEYTKRYWPGPLTIVGEARESSLASQVIREDGTIAVRVSSHPIAQTLSRRLGVPIVATSANLSGESVCYSVSEIKEQFRYQTMQPDLYLDIGTIPCEAPSTIIKEEQGNVLILRQGSIQIE